MENRILNLFRDRCRNDNIGFVFVAETFNVLIENFGGADHREPCSACVPRDTAASVGVWLVTGENVFWPFFEQKSAVRFSGDSASSATTKYAREAVASGFFWFLPIVMCEKRCCKHRERDDDYVENSPRISHDYKYTKGILFDSNFSRFISAFLRSVVFCFKSLEPQSVNNYYLPS